MNTLKQSVNKQTAKISTSKIP